MLDVTAVRDVFLKNHFCVIATTSPAGEPWLAPVFYNYSADYGTIVWESAHDALHSVHVRENTRVAIFIKDAAANGPAADLYLEATAREVPSQHLPEALHLWQDGPHGHSDRSRRIEADYGGTKPMRLYEAQVQRLYVRIETLVDGYRVDVREEVDRAHLRK